MTLGKCNRKTQESCYYNYYTVSKEGSRYWRILELNLMDSVIFDSDVENFLLKLPAYLPAWPASVFLHENPACKLRHVCGCLLKFHPADFVCFFSGKNRAHQLIWLKLETPLTWLLNCISTNDRSGKITGFFCIVCSFRAFMVKRSWMQLNTGHTEACLLKYFILDICPNVAFVCFRMCWRSLMTLLIQLALVEVDQE